MEEEKPVSGDEVESLKVEYYELNRRCLEKLKPSLMMIRKQAYPSKIPIAFPLEIRALVTHLTRARKMFDESIEQINRKRFDEAKKNIDKAGRHYDRCMLDCTKWMCIQLDDLIRDGFARLIAEAPLVQVDNGDYLKELHKQEREARRLHRKAKKLDAKGDGRASGEFEKAAEAYSKLYRLLENPGEKRQQQIENLIKYENGDRIAIYRKAVVGIVVALIGFLINFL